VKSFILHKTVAEFRRSLMAENIDPKDFSLEIKVKGEGRFFHLYSLIKSYTDTNLIGNNTMEYKSKFQFTYMGVCVKVSLVKPRKHMKKKFVYMPQFGGIY